MKQHLKYLLTVWSLLLIDFAHHTVICTNISLLHLIFALFNTYNYLLYVVYVDHNLLFLPNKTTLTDELKAH